MIRLIVREVAGRKGYASAYALAQATGLGYETCRRLWQELGGRIDLRTLDRLCEVLEVQPGLLFEYKATKKKGR